jgi:hypothetical protein
MIPKIVCLFWNEFQKYYNKIYTHSDAGPVVSKPKDISGVRPSSRRSTISKSRGKNCLPLNSSGIPGKNRSGFQELF